MFTVHKRLLDYLTIAITESYNLIVTNEGYEHSFLDGTDTKYA